LVEDKIDKIINMYQNKNGILIQLLLDIQRELSWVPRKAIKKISEKLKIPASQIYRVASFYTAISLKPDSIENKLEIKSGETTNDELFSLETVNCLGCCALGPVIEVDGQYFGKLNSEKLDKLLINYA